MDLSTRLRLRRASGLGLSGLEDEDAEPEDEEPENEEPGAEEPEDEEPTDQEREDQEQADQAQVDQAMDEAEDEPLPDNWHWPNKRPKLSAVHPSHLPWGHFETKEDYMWASFVVDAALTKKSTARLLHQLKEHNVNVTLRDRDTIYRKARQRMADQCLSFEPVEVKFSNGHLVGEKAGLTETITVRKRNTLAVLE